MASSLSPTKSLHVAPNGDDASVDPSNSEFPLRTLQAAADIVQPGEEVLIHSGVYREAVNLLRKRGTAERPIWFRAAPGEIAILSGADVVAGPWEAVKARPGVYRCDLKSTFKSKFNQTEQLFVDGRMLHLSRFPNTTPGEHFEPDKMLTVDRVVMSETIKEGTATPWGDVRPRGAMRATITLNGLAQPDGFWNDSTLFVIPRDDRGMGWGFGCVGPVVKHEKGLLDVFLYFTVKGDGNTPLIDLTAGDPAYLLHRLSALDSPGEWHHDEANGILYVWLPDSSNPIEHTVEIKRRDYAIDLSESSYVSVQGLHIFGATVTTDNLFSKATGGGEWSGGGRGAGEAPSGNAAAHHITLDGLRCQYVSHFDGTWGNAHGQWVQSSGVMLVGEDHVLRNSAIEYSAGNGVVVYGPRHRIINNVIHDVSYAAAHCSGIYLQQTAWDPGGEQVYPLDCNISHNTIYRTGWGGIDASKIYSSNPAEPSEIAFNFIDGAGLLTQDVGGIRLVGRPAEVPGESSRKEPPIKGTRLHHNWIRSVVAPLGNAIYFDFCEGYVADHNLVTDSEGFICVNQSGYMEVANNTGWRVRRGIGGLVSGNENRLNFRELKLRNNVLNQAVQQADERTDPAYVNSNNIEFAASELFHNATENDFEPSAGSKLVDGGAAIDPWTLDHAGSAPDVGAFEVGQENWLEHVGADWSLVAAPSRLAGTASGDGTVSLSWRDNSDNEEGFVIEVAGPAPRHPRPGWVYCVLGRVDADITEFSTTLPRPVREYMFRVRAVRSHYSNTLYLRSGCMHELILFRADQVYQPGNLNGQDGWVGVHGGNGLDQGQPTFAQIVRDSNGNQRLELVADGKTQHSSESLAALGDLSLIEPMFQPGKSRVRFEAKLGVKEIDAHDSSTAAAIHLGGVGFWKSTSPPLANIEILRNGEVKFGGILAGKLKPATIDPATAATVSGVLNLRAGMVEEIRWNDEPIPGEANLPAESTNNIDTALWQLESFVQDAQHAVVIHELRIALD